MTTRQWFCLLLLLTGLGGAVMVWQYHAGLTIPASVFPPDKDGDLLRDDVGRQLRQQYGSHPAAWASLSQLARHWQRAVRQTDPQRLPDEVQDVRRAVTCVLAESTLQKAGIAPTDMMQALEQLHGQMFDTPQRRALWVKFTAATDAVPHIDHGLNPCHFDLAAITG